MSTTSFHVFRLKFARLDFGCFKILSSSANVEHGRLVLLFVSSFGCWLVSAVKQTSGVLVAHSLKEKNAGSGCIAGAAGTSLLCFIRIECLSLCSPSSCHSIILRVFGCMRCSWLARVLCTICLTH